eukprot:scaffold1507_cov134-Isochrysis_galbana.AAC.3
MPSDSPCGPLLFVSRVVHGASFEGRVVIPNRDGRCHNHGRVVRVSELGHDTATSICEPAGYDLNRQQVPVRKGGADLIVIDIVAVRHSEPYLNQHRMPAPWHVIHHARNTVELNRVAAGTYGSLCRTARGAITVLVTAKAALDKHQPIQGAVCSLTGALRAQSEPTPFLCPSGRRRATSEPRTSQQGGLPPRRAQCQWEHEKSAVNTLTSRFPPPVLCNRYRRDVLSPSPPCRFPMAMALLVFDQGAI